MIVRRLIPLIVCVGALAGPLAVGAQTTSSPIPAASGAPAGPAGSGHHRHHNRFDRALRNVNLTGAQEQQIATLRAQTKTANVNADPATRKANEAKLRQQIRAILTPDQQTQLTAALQRRRPATTPGAPLPPNPGPTPGN